MAKTKKVDLSAFNNVLDGLGYGNVMHQEEVSDTTNDIIDNDDIDNLDNNDDITSDVNAEDNESTNENFEDDTEIPEDILNDTNNTTSDSNEDDNSEQNATTEVNENEVSNVGAFFDAFAEELGWDVADDDKPTSVQELVDYMGAMIEQNSKPHYADERIARLDEYVRNGGSFEDFYQRQQQSMSYDNMDMEDESNQKAVIREYLRYQGYEDDQINRKIERYEDGDLLEDEANDAVVRLKSIQQQQIAAQELQQQQAKRAQEEQAREFITNLTNTISSLDNIRGIKIPKSDQKELFDYITKVDADGYTKYQKDFNANMVNNLIESAYFTMKGDTLLNEAKSTGRTSAANKLRTMLRHQSTNHSRYNVNENKQRSVVDLASQFYR